MRNIIFSFLIMLVIPFLLQGCQENTQSKCLQEGDLIFQNLNCGPLCDAIETVTSGVGGRKFTHIGLVVKDNDSLKVIEAIGTYVRMTGMKDFISRTTDSSGTDTLIVGRPVKEISNLIKESIAFAKSQIGKPYDDAFLMDNGKWYCSELIYQAFATANKGKEIFPLQPMTFKDPSSGNFFPAWIEYYSELQQPIPEGKPGINPGGISCSDKLDILFMNADAVIR